MSGGTRGSGRRSRGLRSRIARWFLLNGNRQVVAFSLALAYRANGTTTVAPRYLWLVASAGIGTIVSPFAILITYIVRPATISRYTVSVGPFTPPPAVRAVLSGHGFRGKWRVPCVGAV